MKNIFKHSLLSLALLAGAFTAQAQVKVGSMPTTIAPTSNLEVQAGNGKKVIVDKAAGTLQVENLPTGATTNKIVTADPTGVLQQIDPSVLSGSLSAQVSSMSVNKNFAFVGPYQGIGGGAFQKINFTTPDYDNLGVVDLTNDRLKVTKSGYYTYKLRLWVSTTQGAGSYSIFITKNDPDVSNSFLATWIDKMQGNVSYSISSCEFSNTIYLTANDYLQTTIYPCDNCGGTGPYNVQMAQFSLQYLGN